MRRKPDSVAKDYVETLREILESRKELEVSMDIISVNKLPFLVSIIRGLNLTMIEYLSSKNEIALVTSINKIVSDHKSHSLHVGTMFIDPELQFLEEKAVSTTLNTTGTQSLRILYLHVNRVICNN